MEIPIFSLKEEFENYFDILAIIKSNLNKANIDLKDADDEEEVDEALASLFNLFVVRSITNKVSSFISNLPQLPKYAYYYKDYSKMPYIKVITKSHEDENLAFVQLKSKESAFDTVYCSKLDSSYGVIAEGIEAPLEKCEFQLQFIHLG